MTEPEIEVHRLAAFTDDPSGGNPAGVVVTETPLPADRMQRVAADVGYSETAFLTEPNDDRRTWRVRYFSPVAEVPFCGHATIAAAVLLGDDVGVGDLELLTPVGTVRVDLARRCGRIRATLTSVDPEVRPADDGLLTEVLDACGLGRDHLDDRHAPAVAFAGARHLVVVLRERETLGSLHYDVDRVLAAMVAEDLTTVAFFWPGPDGRWHARNLFPVGGVLEDPATGAAAAAFGAYLRATASIRPPARFEIVQGEDLGRPSHLWVGVPSAVGGIEVAGTAVPLTDGARV